MEQFALEFSLAPPRRILTVIELNSAIRGVLDAEFNDVWVSGEISGLKLASSGHYYFTLKERDAQVRASPSAPPIASGRFKPQDGMAVLARGRIDVYEARGEYQLLVETSNRKGSARCNWPSSSSRRSWPPRASSTRTASAPCRATRRRIGIVTSPRGAAIADMVHILSRRFPGVHIRLFPALVQGEGSVEEVCRGIEYFSRTRWAEVLIVGRGGGSLEDLWTFNEEAVARAIAACACPSSPPSAMRPTSPSPISSPTCARPRPPPPPNWSSARAKNLLDRIAAARSKSLAGRSLPSGDDGAPPAPAGHRTALGVLHRRVGSVPAAHR